MPASKRDGTGERGQEGKYCNVKIKVVESG